MSKEKVLKSLVLSSLLAVSVMTVAQADAVTLGSTATAQEGTVSIGNNSRAENSSIGIGNDVIAEDRGIAIGNKVSTSDAGDTGGSQHTENISIGNRVAAGSYAISHGVGLGSDVSYGMNTIAIGTNVKANAMDSIALGNGVKLNNGKEGISIGKDSEAGLQSITLGSNASSNLRSVAIGLETKTNRVTDAIALGSYSVANRSKLINNKATDIITTSAKANYSNSEVYAADKAIDTDKKAIANTVKGQLGAVSVGNSLSTRQIVNVAAGSADTDAVNVAQLKSVDNRLTLVDGKVEALDGRVTVVEEKIGNIENTGNNNTTEISNIKTDIENQGQTIKEHTDQIKDLDNRVSDNTNSIKDLDGRVTNNTNAINDLTDRVSNHDTAISGLNNRVDKLGTRVNKIGAGAAALAGLHPLDFDDDSKLTFAVGFGAYKNEQAAALGAFYRPNENLMFSFATAVGNSENMYNAGLSFRFGDSSPYQGLSKAELVSALEDQGKDIEVLKAKANEVDTVKAENAALNERLAKLEALLAAR